MRQITEQLHKQITGWRVYSIIGPAVFCAVSAFLYLSYDLSFKSIFYTSLIIFSVTCIAWWHWSLSTMLSMLGIMKDTDDHFDTVIKQLADLQISIKDIDKDK